MSFLPIFHHKIPIHYIRNHNLFLHKIQHEVPSNRSEIHRYHPRNPSMQVSINTHTVEDVSTLLVPRSTHHLHKPNIPEPTKNHPLDKEVVNKQVMAAAQYLLKC